MKQPSPITGILAAMILFAIIYFRVYNSSSKRGINTSKQAEVSQVTEITIKPMQAVSINLKRVSWEVFSVPKNTYLSINRIDRKDIMVKIDNGQGKKWIFGEDPFNNQTYKTVSLKLLDEHPEETGKIFITFKYIK